MAVSDTHFGFEYGRTAETKKLSSERMFNAFKFVLEQARTKNVELILLGGDVFNRSQPKNEIIARAYRIFDEIAEMGIPFLVIPGNHDKSVLPEYLLQHFKKNLFFINKFSTVYFDEFSVIGFPFIAKNPRSALEKAKKIAEKENKKRFIMLCHQLFDGARFGPHNHIFKNRFDILKTDTLPDNIKLVVSGHIHRAQSIQDGKVNYTGSLERTSFMEIIEPKGYLIIDSDDDFSVKFNELPSSPMNVHEFSLTRNDRLSNILDGLNIDNQIKTLLRFTGRTFKQNDIKYLWANFTAKEYPWLSFSPRRENSFLRPLYGNKSWNFNYS